jgi:RNA polymerase sigma-70 factor (ECF subfamily)
MAERDYQHYTDQELVALFRAERNRDALGVLFQRHSGMALSTAMKYLGKREEASDMVMQVFEKVFQDLPRHEVKDFRPWLHMVVKNSCLMDLRKTRETPARNEQEEKYQQMVMENRSEVHPSEKMETEKRLQELERAIDLLSQEQRICIRLFYLEQKSYSEVAEHTGYTLNHVKSYIQNGKRNLQISLQKQL